MADIGFTYTGNPPIDLAAAPARAQRAYWREAARAGIVLRRASLARGLGANGKPVQPISSRTRRNRARNIDPRTGRTPYSPMGRARPDAPPLQSTGAKSRTRAWLYGKGETDRAWFGWRNGWGDILAMHRTGFYVTFANGKTAWVPPRDVIGLPPADVAALDRHMAQWWAANRERYTPPPVETVIWYNPERRKGNLAFGEGRDVFTSGETGESETRDASGNFRIAGGEYDKYFRDINPKPRNPSPRPPSRARMPEPVLARRVPRRPVPLLGVPYDGPLPDAIRNKLPDELQGIETFGQLSRSRAGRLWWAAIGLILFLELLRRAAA